MTYSNIYGVREGLAERLEDWIERISTDRYLPWMGTGIIADLKAAIAEIRGEPEQAKPLVEWDL